jgi:acetyl/propionyl-CoA carboxylase alpha subunit
MRYHAEIEGNELTVELQVENGNMTAIVDGAAVPVTVSDLGTAGAYAVLIGNRSFEFFVHRNAMGTWITHGGRAYHCRLENIHRAVLTQTGVRGEQPHAMELRAPMPGLVLEVRVREGDVVHEGQGVLVVEAMKMENELRAPCAGTVKEVRVKEKQSVEQNQLLIVFA